MNHIKLNSTPLHKHRNENNFLSYKFTQLRSELTTDQFIVRPTALVTHIAYMGKRQNTEHKYPGRSQEYVQRFREVITKIL